MCEVLERDAQGMLRRPAWIESCWQGEVVGGELGQSIGVKHVALAAMSKGGFSRSMRGLSRSLPCATHTTVKWLLCLHWGERARASWAQPGCPHDFPVAFLQRRMPKCHQRTAESEPLVTGPSFQSPQRVRARPQGDGTGAEAMATVQVGDSRGLGQGGTNSQTSQPRGPQRP